MKFSQCGFVAVVFLSLAPLRGVTQELGPGSTASQELGTDSKSSMTEAEAAKRRAEEEKERLEKIRQSKCIITVDMEMVQLPQKLALEILPALRSDEPKKVEAAVAEIQQRISKGEATLIAWPMVTARDGQRAVAEAIVEERYPTEFDPPQEPTNLGGPVKPKPNLSPTPTSFETRNTGTTLEVESTMLADGKHILLSFVPQRVELAEMKNWFTGRTKDGAEVHLDQPIFHTQKVTGEQIVISGQPSLIAVHVLPDKDHPMEFFIARAVATKID